ncbi:MAG: superoxide dismutase family protein [Desulfovibrionales bacterium]
MRYVWAIFMGSVMVMIAGSAVLAQHGTGGDVQRAVAVIAPIEGEQVRGVVHFSPDRNGLSIKGEFWNLEQGSHGFHVHKYGDCTAPRQDSVGPHYLPVAAGDSSGHGHQGGHEHGHAQYHGDLPQIEAGSEGSVNYEATVDSLSLEGENSIIGRSLLVHDSAGEKIGCGVIGVGK